MKRARPEAKIQEAVCKHLEARAPKDCFWFHPANGGYRTPWEARAFKRMGVKAGVPDICAIHQGRFYALELKAPGGRSTESQIEARMRIDDAGGYSSEAVGLDRAIAVLESWGLLK